MSKSKQLTTVKTKQLQIFWNKLTNSECEAIKGGFTPDGILEIKISRPGRCPNPDDYAPGC